MDPRQRFGSIMHYGGTDRLPLWSAEGLPEGTVRQWIIDGHVPVGVACQDVVDFDPCTIIHLDTTPLPAFVTRTIDEDDRWRTEIDRYGFTVRTSKTQSVGPTLYYYLAGSVRGRSDWEKMKRRFEASDPRRRPREWSADLFEHYNSSPEPVGMRIGWGPGRGMKNGYMLGFERFLETLIADPALLEEMFDFWADFVIAAARDWFDNVRFDFVCINEDGMGYRNSTIVSPDTYRRIWAPHVRRVVEFIRGRGVDVVGYLTSGNIRPLIPTLLDIGINLHLPLECAAGLDARQLRREFGRELMMIGNISRQAVMDGPEAVEREFHEKVPPLMAAGGYIPAIDDMIMPDMPYPAVRRYVELVRQFKP